MIARLSKRGGAEKTNGARIDDAESPVILSHCHDCLVFVIEHDVAAYLSLRRAAAVPKIAIKQHCDAGRLRCRALRASPRGEAAIDFAPACERYVSRSGDTASIDGIFLPEYILPDAKAQPGARQMNRLSLQTLTSIAGEAARPRYDVAAQRVGIVHLGLGAFHRAHQAVYVDDRLAAGEAGWAICGASLRSPATREALQPQDGLYALSVRSAAGEALRVVGALRRLIVAPEDPQALIAAMSDPAVRIVTLTVTEKGYCYEPASRRLDEDHPDIRHDLLAPHGPKSAPGYLVEALARRRAAGVAPFAVVSCDNLPSNGATARAVVARLAALRDADLGRFVAGEVAFPSTMVDRIVPATTDEDRARIAARLGAADAFPVVTEPFTQWVIEDRFPLGRPRFEDSGATLVADVAPFELAKLRLLNGAHSTLAYLSYLAGYETVAEAMADENLARLVADLMTREAAPTLGRAAGPLEPYIGALLARFRNPALRHRTWQIAMDGSQKLPQRLLATARARLAQGEPIARIALGVAAWMRYVSGVDEHGRAIDVCDPLAARLRAIAERAGLDAERLAPALASVTEVFGADLAADPRFLGAVTAALRALLADGARKTLADYARALDSP